jgi:pyruvate dehydrogenase E2 component (dihydrolipoamide acetyltransferase)
MASEITMPQLSDTMTEGTLVKWHAKEGDKVKENQKIADVETDKAVMEMECFDAGTLAVVVVAEGDKVPVGAILAVVAVGNESVAEVKAKYAGIGKQIAKPAEVHHEKLAAGAPSMGTTAVVDAPAAIGENAGAGGIHRVKASPLAKRIARERGVDLSAIEGSGPGGRIVQKDILQRDTEQPRPLTRGAEPMVATAAVAAGAAAAPAAKAPAAALPAPRVSGSKEVIPMTKIRQVIAQRLQQSKQTIPHFYETIDIDMEAVSDLRERVNAKLEKEKIRISVGDFIAKAVAAALVAHPALNATFNGTEVTQYADVNLGMAVALPNGLIVPVLRGINNMGVKEIRLRSSDLVDRARGQKLKQDEMSGATFTVSNLGTFGIREFSAIVNPPEVGILAIGASEARAVVREGVIVARQMMTVTLSADHRVVDGATAAEFLRTLKGYLEEPGTMLV